METKTIVNRIVEDSNGNQINRNDVVEMLVDGRIIVGRFLGIGSRGAWIFTGATKNFNNVQFSVSPRAIKHMFLLREED